MKSHSSVYSKQGIVSKLVPEEEQVPEVIELQQTIVEPEREIKSYVPEERKVAAKPAQVVNALEVLLAFAEVEESKVAMESTDAMDATDAMQMQDTPEHSQSSESNDRLTEMEKLAAAMQGDLEQEWQMEQQEEAAILPYEEPSASEAIVVEEQVNQEIVENMEAEFHRA